MINLQLDINPKTEQRLKKVIETVHEQEIFAQNLIGYHISELKKAILKIRLDLKKFEDTYQISTEAFYTRFQNGKTDDREDYMIWSGLYEMLQDNELSLQELL